MSDSTPCYVGIKDCGCAVTVVVDEPEYKKEAARAVAEWIRDGLTIERHTVDWVRANVRRCKHNPARKDAPDVGKP